MGSQETRSPLRHIRSVLPKLLSQIAGSVEQGGEAVLAIWPELVGPKIAPMTQAVSFVDGILTVKVRNSSLYSLLEVHEKKKLIQALRKRLPTLKIYNIVFRVG